MKWVRGFQLQETLNFPEGAPQRESYLSDEDYDMGVRAYQDEWKRTYRCRGCEDQNCPGCA